MNWLDLLLSRVPGGVSVESEIFSFDSTRSGSNGVILIAAKLV